MENTLSAALMLLAQQGGGGGGGGFDWTPILTIYLPIGVLFWFLLIRPQQRERRQRAEMLRAVKKNDRVVTAGGIYGVVTNIHREADEITIKVDEATNTKLRLTVGSVTRVVGADSSDDSSSK